MTATLERDDIELEPHEPTGEGPPEEPTGDGGDEREVRITMVAAAAALTSVAGAWMVSRLFRGTATPLAVALLGVAIGVGIIALSYRLRRPGLAQYLVLPVAVIVGGALATTTGAGRGGSLPELVADAVRGGGLSQPPIAFAPGWVFLSVLLFALVGAAATATAAGLARPKLAVAIPLPVTLGAALVQPEGSELVASGVAIVLVVAGLAVAYGADLASEGVIGSGFEVRRMARGGALLVAVIVALGVLAQTNLLFPATDRDEVIPPRRPPPPSPEPDRVLFTVKSDRPGPWRLGVLDVYEDNAFLLPSIDPARLLDVDDAGVVDRTARPTFTATFTVNGLKGQSLPAAPNPVSIDGRTPDMTYDPRTQVFKLVDRANGRGLTYTVEAPVPPDGRELAAAPPPDPRLVAEFTAAPPAPAEVVTLLAAAPTANLFDRLQAVRQALYGNVVAAGAGEPGEVAPRKVVDMIKGGEATPYEIVAGEVLLARWAGVPARIGYGFFGGEKATDEALEFRPRHGAAFLEAYFEGYGWVPVLGTPPKAKASLSDEQKNQDPKVVPTDELGLVVFVPVRFQSIRQLYETVRYWASIVVPILLALACLVAAYPAGLKAARSWRRERWARERGPSHRIAVAYAELRDRANDLNIGNPRSSPLEFLAAIEDDDEHAELAWLVTRALWGDLKRDLRLDDVEAAEELATSVRRRLYQEQSGLNRFLALIARSSLRDPWSDEVPNGWGARKRSGLRRPVGMLRPAAATAAIALIAVPFMAMGSCGRDDRNEADRPSRYPDPLVPAAAAGFDIVREEKVEDQYRKPGDRALVTDGRVFTIRGPDAIQGSFQVTRFKSDVDASDPDVQRGIERALGSADGFRSSRIGTIRLRTIELTEQRLYLWFPPDRNAMELWILRKNFAEGEDVVRAMIAHQRGLDLSGTGA